MKDTVIINLFAGPGAGKSTGAAYIFSQLKMMGIDAEYVSEFAKDKVWENNSEVFKLQMYVTGKQAFKISRCFGKVDVIVTDSPILIGANYCSDNPPLIDGIVYEFNKYDGHNLNFFIRRVKPYNPNGRHQKNEEEAREKDKEIMDFLMAKTKGNFNTYNGDQEGYDAIVKYIVDFLGQRKKNEA